MPSFDIVSEIDMTEARNTVDNADRELSTRFDFRGVEASFELKDEVIVLKSESEQQVMQLFDMLVGKAAKRGLDVASFELKDVEKSGKYVSRKVMLKQGIDKDMAKKVVKAIKDSKIKVQASIQGETVRVTGKKRDDLQETMQLIRGAELGQPFQFKNFRD
ncbi:MULTISPECIES: YajQ family cyclic di-GMP-binding protein [Pseudoalteromonas]|uniref:Nucleotide-binding protein C3B51_08495 n=2 Tax=Pseudoalteromonas TaxID=53246 RepID=A0A0F4QL02_9GAMM|nr:MULTISPECIES: YajQ family cyclic di-GMP-binding protein [Pseudoalteromonas]KJZ08321.1 nucleotide-binding protein [Pseudoalteromonas rubra]MCF2907689.1 YajQ family cyclic di-GMP-binding protein [Pseudoalteromonas sp. DL2-H2.2]QTL36977.1 YajQ family cyclic di-GMP-binding protein [Pseudoalteromonas viridis]RZM81476.1 YajQ family cyclic di-GMP-binding protein [Pseudoalteromonas rubra]